VRRSAKYSQNAAILTEKKVISEFMQHIAMDDSLYAIGLKDTFTALQLGAVKLLIFCEKLDVSIVSVLKRNHEGMYCFEYILLCLY